ncbi:MAG: glutamate 5-kinase [bacterium]
MRRIVIKVGTALLTDSRGGISRRIISRISGEIAALREKNFRIAVVSSGAIGCGMIKMNVPKPKDVSGAQVLSSIGQPILMNLWVKALSKHGLTAAQILCSADDFSQRNKYLNLRRTILQILASGVVPIINENDSVAVDEIKFGDNDRLSALVASHIEAETLVILTDVKGILVNGEIVREIHSIDRALLEKAGAASGFGTGGMRSKLLAAKITQLSGCKMIIASGKMPGVLSGIFLQNQQTGTAVYTRGKIKNRKRWIVFGRLCGGSVFVDNGAYLAVSKKGKSLLPAGITGSSGSFRKGDAVNLCSGGKKFAKGLVNYSREEIEKIRGKKSSEIKKVLGYAESPEAIHRDSLVLLLE